jgi:hypothetical protein
MTTKIAGGLALASAVLALLGGCASTPPPTDKLALAESAVQRAERAGAQQAAPGELGAAREKLQRAQSSAKSDAPQAARLAEQAEADATLAESRAEAQRARNALTSVQQGLDALREEAARAGNANDAASGTSAPTTTTTTTPTPLPPGRP